MEDQVLVMLILGVYIPSFVGLLWVLRRPKTGKKKVQELSSDSVAEMFDTSSKGYKDIVKVKDNQIQSLTAKLRRANEEENQDQENLLDQEPSWEDIKAIAKTQGINPLLLEIPMVKKEVKKLIRGMSIQEIAENVGEVKKLGERYGFKFGTKEGDKSKDAVDSLFEQDPNSFA